MSSIFMPIKTHSQILSTTLIFDDFFNMSVNRKENFPYIITQEHIIRIILLVTKIRVWFKPRIKIQLS